MIMRVLAGFVVGTFFGMYLAIAYPNQVRDSVASVLGALLGK